MVLSGRGVLNSGDMHKTLPHNLELEAAVLAASLLDSQALLYVLQHLTSGDFYHPAYRNIFAAAKKLNQQHKPVDLVHMLAVFKDQPEHEVVLELSDSLPSSAGVKSYCDGVFDLAQRRRAIAALQEAIDACYDLDTDEPLAQAQAKLMAFTKAKAGEAREIGDLVEDAYGRAWEAHQRRLEGEVVRAAHVHTGINPLDDMLTIKKGDMVIVGARPSAGKTSVGLQIAMHVAQEKPVLFFSLEEPAQQIADRYLVCMTGVPMRRTQEGSTTAEELDRLVEAQASAQYSHLVVNDTPALRVSDMRSIAMRLQISRGQEWGAIMVDHMIKVRPEDGKAQGHQKLTQVSQDLKNMARTMRVPVIVLTQLRRPQSEEAEPVMSDLRESGSIEEDADSILLIHRPERDKSYSMARFLLTKQRTGPCGAFELMFDAERMRFKQMKGFGGL